MQRRRNDAANQIRYLIVRFRNRTVLTAWAPGYQLHGEVESGRQIPARVAVQVDL